MCNFAFAGAFLVQFIMMNDIMIRGSRQNRGTVACNIRERMKRTNCNHRIHDEREKKKQKWTVWLMSSGHAHEPIYRRVIEHAFQFEHTYDALSARRLHSHSHTHTHKRNASPFLSDGGDWRKENKAEMAVANGAGDASVAVCYWSAAVKWLRLWNWGMRDLHTSKY